MNPRLEGGTLNFMDGINGKIKYLIMEHRRVDWRNHELKSLNSVPVQGT